MQANQLGGWGAIVPAEGAPRVGLVVVRAQTLCSPMDRIARQAPQSMRFPRQDYWSGLPFPSPDLPDPGIEPVSPASPALARGFFTTEPPWKPKGGLRFSSAAQSCPTLCDPMDLSTPGFPVHHNSRSLLKLLSIALVRAWAPPNSLNQLHRVITWLLRNLPQEGESKHHPHPLQASRNRNCPWRFRVGPTWATL